MTLQEKLMNSVHVFMDSQVGSLIMSLNKERNIVAEISSHPIKVSSIANTAGVLEACIQLHRYKWAFVGTNFEEFYKDLQTDESVVLPTEQAKISSDLRILHVFSDSDMQRFKHTFENHVTDVRKSLKELWDVWMQLHIMQAGKRSKGSVDEVDVLINVLGYFVQYDQKCTTLVLDFARKF
jgi:hypothetical protein